MIKASGTGEQLWVRQDGQEFRMGGSPLEELHNPSLQGFVCVGPLADVQLADLPDLLADAAICAAL